MKKILPAIALVILLLTQVIVAASFPSSAVPLPAGWTGPVFHLSQNYPVTVPPDKYPWLTVDPIKEPGKYMAAVLAYCLEGNVQNDWDLQKNTVRPWVHAPWMHWGDKGREPIHGLTLERSSRPGDLAPTQKSTFQNWAVGMYNAPGGVSFGKVWADPEKPDVKAALFP